MGKTSFSGPVFGAYSLLFTTQGDKAQGSTVAVQLGAVVVPPGQDWLICDFQAYRGSTQSTACTFTLRDDSTNIASVAITSSVAGLVGSTRLAKDGGEYLGTLVAEGSTVDVQFLDGTSSLASSGLRTYVYGYPRWKQNSSNSPF